MKDLSAKLSDYLNSLSEYDFSLVSSVEGKKLPLFLREHYALYDGSWMGKTYLMALEKMDWDPGTPKEYRSQMEQIQALVKRPVVLVLPSLTASVRNRLAGMRIPFIVPGTQLFLPEVWMDLSEKYPGLPNGDRSKRFPPTAQLMLLYHLQHEKIDTLNGKELAKRLGCTSAMVSKCRDAFEQAGLCTLERAGKALHMRFQYQGPALWEMALPYLSNPVQERHWVQSQPDHDRMLKAGISALSEQTLLADDRLPTFCMPRSTWNPLLKQGQLQICPDADQALFGLEIWSYDPWRLCHDKHIDTLSLWLSLRDDPDERVQSALHEIRENVKWQ
jgi:biotin operon repressor